MYKNDYKEFDVIKINRDFEGIKAGETGVIVAVFEKPNKAYEVEFVDDNGATKATFVVTEEEIGNL